MKRHRRNFTNEFKTQVVTAILKGPDSRSEISKKQDISLPLLNRWINDYVAAQRNDIPANVHQIKDRRRDYQDTMTLKAKIAELYMQLEQMQRVGGQQTLTR